MAGLIFDEKSMIENNIFKYEQRLMSHTNKYHGIGAMLVTYYGIAESATTVDRGIRDVEKLFGRGSAIRYNRHRNFPIYEFGQVNPSNTDELQVEDINVEGEFIIQPSTIVPNPNDIFIIEHLRMKAIFHVTNVSVDSMKPQGFYKCTYRLHSTSVEMLSNIEKQVVGNYHTELNAIGSNINPIIQEDDFVLRNQVRQMVNKMIESYRSLFYNSRHNCFLFFHDQDRHEWFDLCANEFIGKHGLMNPENSTNVIMISDKLNEKQMAKFYNDSVYNWIEIGAPKRLLQHFHFTHRFAEQYIDSSFFYWSETDIKVVIPLALEQTGILNRQFSFFNQQQIDAFEDEKAVPSATYEQLIHKYINHPQSISLQDISLYTADHLLASNRHTDVYFYTPVIIYIIRKILRMN